MQSTLRTSTRASRHSIKHGYTFENSVLDAEYTMRIRFSWEPGSPATRDEPETPSHPFDLEVQWVDVEIDGCRMTLGAGSVKYFNGLLASDDKFRAEVEAACIEHVCDTAAAALESHVEAQQQARRDGDL